MLYVRTPLHGNEFKVCDEITDEVVALFFNQNDAIKYVNIKNKYDNAPEMLEMLVELINIQSSSFILDELQERAKVLIKESTELNN